MGWRSSRRSRRNGSRTAAGSFEAPTPQSTVDLERRRDDLNARVAELQWDLGGLVYEMATRDQLRVDVLVRRAAELQQVDSELGEVERILRLEQHSTAGECPSCAAPHSAGAAYCWQCGNPLLQEVLSEQIAAPAAPNGELAAARPSEETATQPNWPVT